MAKILIVEDQHIMRDALKEALSLTDGFEIIASLSDASLAPVTCEKLHPDLCLMDICTENDSSGIDACRDIKKTFPSIRGIMMTGRSELSFVERSKQAGADAFIYKDMPLSDLVSTINQVLNGYTTFPGTIRCADPDFRYDISCLTDREKDILKMICLGMTRSEIAEELCIKDSSVKTHFSNILSKTGFSSISKLAIYSLSNGYINPRI